jgi:CheY-like chemotaxis protein
VYAGAIPLPLDYAVPEIEPEKKFVLIVEDNSETAFVYTRYLGNAGFQSHAVASIDEARRFLEKLRPAAIILDVLLRAENTWDFLRELKGQSPSIPVLVMSVTDDERKVYGMGADAYLTKPFVPEQMIDALMKLTSTQARPTILMIDDNEVSRYLLRGSISDSRYDIYEARDGREGVQTARELKPALIFLDFYMPGITGDEVLKDLRGNEATARIPVVLHSTKILEEAEREFFQSQGVAIFPKQALALPDSALRIRELLETLIAHGDAEARHA